MAGPWGLRTRGGTFLGSGAWCDIGTIRGLAWLYQYSSGYDKGTFRRDTNDRFMYKYARVQWYDSGNGSTPSWQELGPSGRNAEFLGNASLYDLGMWNGADWQYQYSPGYDKGTFKLGSADRFLYRYASGQWYDKGNVGGWNPLSTSGLSASFMGDGSSGRDIGNGWSYTYGTSDDSGHWSGSSSFRYLYATGEWGFTASNWLLGTGLSSDFVGVVTKHDLGNGWLFSYDVDGGFFYRNETGTPLRFIWNLSYGWQMMDGFHGDNAMQGFDNIGTTWMWDGVVHDVYGPGAVDPWRVEYNYALDEFGFYASLSTYDPLAILKYAWADHKWHDRRIASDGVESHSGPWCHIPTGGSMESEIQRAYWTGWIYNTGDAGSGEHIRMNVATTWSYGPFETITRDDSPGIMWTYYYLTGDWYRNSTKVGSGDPDLYR